MVASLDLLLALNEPVPRYTSYPTAPVWKDLPSSLYKSKLLQIADKKGPLSLYVHIPFCKTMCLYCACSVVLNRKVEVEDEYVEHLLREIALVASYFGERKKVSQLHFGGGTPTKLSLGQFDRILEKLHSFFDIDPAGEIAIEIDPRTVSEDGGEKLTYLRSSGFNRVSLGIQDVDPKVQQAVRRNQSAELTETTFHQARALGFSSINIDLIYGLPYQTLSTFEETSNKIKQLGPDRIALFSYAKVPWLKPHQKAIKDDTLPSLEEKFRIYLQARQAFVHAGYKAIGMDHFALLEDELVVAYENKTLKRNFQGYTALAADDLIGFGITSIGYVGGAYFQNKKELKDYYAAIKERDLPAFRGIILSEDDLVRKYVIEQLMCCFRVDKNEVSDRYSLNFDSYFAIEIERLQKYIDLQLLVIESGQIRATEAGELFIRNISSSFDKYLHADKNKPITQFSRAI